MKFGIGGREAIGGEGCVAWATHRDVGADSAHPNAAIESMERRGLIGIAGISIGCAEEYVLRAEER
jgi:hypothetical protein